MQRLYKSAHRSEWLMFERLYKVQNSRLMWKIHRELFFVVQDKTQNKYLSREHVARRVQTR